VSSPPAGDEPVLEAPHPLVALLAWCGLALAVMATLEVVAIVAQGVAIHQARLGPVYRLGYAFLTNLDTVPLGLILLLAVVLVVLPVVAGRATDEALDRQAAFTLGLVASFSLLIAVGSILAVAARVRVDHLRSVAVTSLTWRVLISYLIRNLGTALISLLAAVVALRTRFGRTIAPGPAETVTPSP
jgi:hypothetical protein